ncbi:MAG: right-handed parallel beta-helix repeat-containing protein [Deltaproteobacteria bacterium]|nr:right-handed parallel beta-helix repeat-containing protein [Deltaproteobacteria bacterium]
MRQSLRLASLCVALTAAAPLVACGDDGGAAIPAGCDQALSPEADDVTSLQTAFIDAQSGETICLKAGTYKLNRKLSLANHADITIKGIGATRDDVVLDFGSQAVGDDAFVVTADGFTIQDLSIKNSPGNGIVVQADQSRFSNIKVSWDAGSVTDNGAYAVYPNDCSKTIIEDSEVVGAADAGIYVGSCDYAIVRRNKVHGNVAGIEIENSHHADVYENESYDNTAGILVFALPNLKVKSVGSVLVRDNDVHDNNRQNFAEAGSIVSFVPKGLGFLLLAAKDVEIRDNTVSGNDGAGIVMVSFGLMETLTGGQVTNNDPDLDPYLERIYVHSNTFTDNGTNPTGAMLAIGASPLENVLWDGDVREGGDAEICLGASPTSFRDFAGLDAENATTDTTGHTCTLAAQTEYESFDGVGN